MFEFTDTHEVLIEYLAGAISAPVSSRRPKTLHKGDVWVTVTRMGGRPTRAVEDTGRFIARCYALSETDAKTLGNAVYSALHNANYINSGLSRKTIESLYENNDDDYECVAVSFTASTRGKG